MKFFFLFLLFIYFESQAGDNYKRSDWRHWIDHDRDCQNTRHELLIERSLVPAVLNSKGCKVVAGEWEDFYTAERIIDPRQIDIDHVVPLAFAAQQSGRYWNSEQKKQFANDPLNLVITHRKLNRSKGRLSIVEWLPANKNLACRYIWQWIKVKEKYQMPIMPPERNTIHIAQCPIMKPE